MFKKIIRLLDENPMYREYLFKQGFIITDDTLSITNDFPFYNNWKSIQIYKINFYIKNDLKFYYQIKENQCLFLIGHAYNPVNGVYDENTIIDEMLSLDESFFDYEKNLTGIYVMGKFSQSGSFEYWTDCAGMRISYTGHINDRFYITSHTNILAYLLNLEESDYVYRLKHSKYFHLFGNVLPADLSAYEELKRVVPNHIYSKNGCIKRFFPCANEIKEIKKLSYDDILNDSAKLLRNTMSLIVEKYHDSITPYISLTGGKDSNETFASANNHYTEYKYFSYISKPEESPDAYAASKICKYFHLNHEIYNILESNENCKDFDIVNELIYINGGSIGYIRDNEVRKRSYLISNTDIKLEVKSWVNEITRAYWYKKYNKNKFPKKPSGKYLTSMYKVFIENRSLYNETVKYFNKYIDQYMNQSDIELFNDWTTLWSWEFGFSAGEAQSLFAEHILSFDITIPFNNRHLISLMLNPSILDQKKDKLQKDIIKKNNESLYQLNIDINNVAHTQKRANLEKLYLFINTHIPF